MSRFIRIEGQDDLAVTDEQYRAINRTRYGDTWRQEKRDQRYNERMQQPTVERLKQQVDVGLIPADESQQRIQALPTYATPKSLDAMTEERSDSWVSDDDVEEAVAKKILHAEKLKSTEQERQESVRKVEVALSGYIEPVFARLRESEALYKKLANRLYLCSASALIVTIVIAIILLNRADRIMSALAGEGTVNLIIYGILGLSIIIIMISLSRFLFTLAKSYMVESIRCSDRVHAISFGKCFIDAYGANATHEEIIKVFSSWNIDGGDTSFRNQSGDDYDPKLSDLISLAKK